MLGLAQQEKPKINDKMKMIAETSKEKKREK